MAVHVESINDLAKTNEGVAVALNRYADWVCSKGVTEAPLIPKKLTARLADYTRTSLKQGSVALNYSHLALTLGPTVSVGVPGSALVELINPNMDGPFQVMCGQSLSWSPGSGKPCLMIFSIHHQLAHDAEPFRVRVTNNGIPTKGVFARCHAFWGFDLSSRIRYYRNEPARRIDLEVGYLQTYLSNIKQVREYVQYTFDSSRADRRPQLCTKSSMSVIPEIEQPAAYAVIAPTVRVAAEGSSSELPEVARLSRAPLDESTKSKEVDHRYRSKSPLSTKSPLSAGPWSRMAGRSQTFTKDSTTPIKRGSDGKEPADDKPKSPLP